MATVKPYTTRLIQFTRLYSGSHPTVLLTLFSGKAQYRTSHYFAMYYRQSVVLAYVATQF